MNNVRNYERCPILLKKRRQLENSYKEPPADLNLKTFAYQGVTKNTDVQDYEQLRQNIIKEKQLKKIRFNEKN